MYFYGTPKKLLVYRFETGSLSYMDFTGVTIDNNIDIIDDYSGNMYVVTTDGIYKMDYKETLGYFGLSNIDIQELNYSKRLSNITTDAIGTVLVNGLKPNSVTNEIRKVNLHNKPLADRKPNSWVDFTVGFQGIFYNLGLNMEVFPNRKT